MNDEPRTELTLRGLDGSNPLAFLAALGTLRAATTAWGADAVRMHWTQDSGAPRPVLQVARPDLTEARCADEVLESLTPAELLFPSSLVEAIARLGKKWSGKFKFPSIPTRSFLREASLAGAARRTEFDAIAAWCCEFVAEIEEGEARSAKTPFDFTSGQQTLLGMMSEVIRTCTSQHVRQSLFAAWKYASEASSLRWDPLDEGRRYALNAIDPSNTPQNPILSVLGANRLAIEGLLFFPLVPVRGRIALPGFVRFDRRSYWRWPIWDRPISSEVVGSLLASAEVIAVKPRRDRLQALGVAEVLASEIVKPSGRYRCFTPSTPV